MRLIDADKLGVGRCSEDVLPSAYCNGWNGLIQIIENAEVVDAVPVIRCRHCKYWGDDAGTLKTSSGEAFARCVIHNHFVGGRHVGWCPKANDFCSRGESKEDKK